MNEFQILFLYNCRIQQFPIPGLENRHLEFLGLLGSSHDPSTRENIPANKVIYNIYNYIFYLVIHCNCGKGLTKV